jgi:hypothetical protein
VVMKDTEFPVCVQLGRASPKDFQEFGRCILTLGSPG